MSEPVFRIAVSGDDHVGYAAKCRLHAASGLNERTRDGHLALRARVDSAIAADVDLYVNTGDIFHRSHPQIGEIVWARQQLNRLAAAGIPVIGNTGNHDASSDRGKAPATAAVNDPDRGIEFVTEPYRLVQPVDGLAIHMISHYGLAQSERLIPEPIDGAVNILSAHGAAMVPGHEVFHCVDSPGEQPIGLDLLTDDRYAATVLGHYHGMDEIMPNVWYAGSAIRRGFSDPAGGRGWLLVKVFADGRVEVERKFIDQRPQFDLPVIDAAGLTGAEVEEAIRLNLAEVDLGDAIVRQVVTNCTTTVRRGIDQPALAKIAEPALMWMPDFRRPEIVEDPTERTVEGAAASLTSAGSVDLPAMYGGFVSAWAKEIALPEEMAPKVVTEGDRHLRAAAAQSNGDFETPKVVEAADTARKGARRAAPVNNRGAATAAPVTAGDTSWMDDLYSGAREDKVHPGIAKFLDIEPPPDPEGNDYVNEEVSW